LDGCGAEAGAGGFALVVGPVATVRTVAVRGREVVALAPPHPASTAAIITQDAATAHTRDLSGGGLAVVGGDIALASNQPLLA
jgi:hypothetical protein